MRASEDYFSVFGVSPAFGQDASLLQKRFYETSRALHPDRFSTGRAEWRARSLERMSFVNEAFRTLRDPALLRDYVLKLEGVSKPSVGAPVELSESWFEIQDLLLEDPEKAQASLEKFAGDLSALKTRFEDELGQLERELDDSGFAREGLQRLARKMQEMSYLKSMERDLERVRQRMAS